MKINQTFINFQDFMYGSIRKPVSRINVHAPIAIMVLKVKCMQRSGTESIRTKIQPPKSKQEITKITNSQNTNRTYGQPIEQLFRKRWPLSTPNRTKNNMNTRKDKRHRNSDPKHRQQSTTTKLPPWNGQ